MKKPRKVMKKDMFELEIAKPLYIKQWYLFLKPMFRGNARLAFFFVGSSPKEKRLSKKRKGVSAGLCP